MKRSFFTTADRTAVPLWFYCTPRCQEFTVVHALRSKLSQKKQSKQEKMGMITLSKYFLVLAVTVVLTSLFPIVDATGPLPFPCMYGGRAQQLILAEMGARRRLARKRLPPTEDDASLSSRPTSVSSAITSPRWRREDGEPKQRSGDICSVESRGKKVVRDGSVFGDASATRFGPGAAGRGGLRRELRVQMNIERKRARLFEDIRMLPYM